MITFLLHFLFPILFTHSLFSKNNIPPLISYVHLALSHPNPWLYCPLHLLWLNPTSPSRPIFPSFSCLSLSLSYENFPNAFSKPLVSLVPAQLAGSVQCTDISCQELALFPSSPHPPELIENQRALKSEGPDFKPLCWHLLTL